MGPFEIDASHIAGLDQYELTRLLARLLRLEAGAYGLYVSGIHVPLEISVADGGEDGRMEWRDGPERTEFVPKRLTVFQCKAQDMGPQKCYDEMLAVKGKPEVGLKAQVAEVLQRGGAYVIFCRQAVNRRANNARMKKMCAALADGGLTKPQGAMIHFFDANHIAMWVNKFPGAQVYVRELCGRNVAAGLRTWEEWGRHEDMLIPYVRTDQITRYIEAIRQCCRGHGTGIIRVTGLSGLGKTRLVLEAFRRREGDPADIEYLQNMVVYADDARDGRELRAFIQDEERWGEKETIVVADECEGSVHLALCNALKYGRHKTRLITLDFNPERRQNDCDCVNLSPEDCKGVVKGIIEYKYAGLPKATAERIEEFAQGFASIAVLLARQAEEGSEEIGSLASAEQLMKRLLFGRERIDNEVQKVLTVCSLFDCFRLERPDGGKEVGFMAESLAKISKKRFLEICDVYEKRGILQRRGGLVRVSPVPLAITLAAEWYGYSYQDDVGGTIAQIKNNGMLEVFCEQARKLSFSPQARGVVEQLLGPQGPFGNPDALLSEEGSRLFRALVEVNPPVAVEALDRCLERYGREGLLGITGKVRRNLVCAMERLCWWKGTFEVAWWLVLRLAAAENEEWRNNATGLFLGLSQVYLPGTRASLYERGRVFKEGMKSEYSEERTLVVRALGKALKSEGFSRSCGAESQGSRVPERDYEPKPAEVRDYWAQCIEILVSEATSSSELTDLARSELAAHISALVNCGMLDEVERGIREIVNESGAYWPAALAGVRDLLDEDSKSVPEAVRARLEALESLLMPVGLEERLRLIVSIPDWRHKEVEKGEFVDLAAEEAKLLAKELAGRDDWYGSLDIVLRGEQRAAYVFGRTLGELSEAPERFVCACLQALRSIPAQEGDPRVLGGFLFGNGNRELIDKTLESVVSDDELMVYGVTLTWCLTIDEKHLRRLFSLIGKEGVLVGDFERLAFGRALDHLSEDVVIELCSRLEGQGKEGLVVAFQIIYMYCHQNDARFAVCTGEFKRMLGRSPELLIGVQGNRCGHMWRTVAERILEDAERDTEFARTLTAGIMVACGTNEVAYSTIEHCIKDVAAVLLTHYFKEVWSDLGGGLLTQNWVLVHNLEHVLGLSTEREGGKAAIAGMPEEVLKWCADNVPNGPAIIAQFTPVFKSEKEDEWHPLAKGIIERFGDLEEVRNGFFTNLWSFSSWGPRAPFYERRIRLLKELFTDERKEVRKWVNAVVSGFEKERDESKLESEEWGWRVD